MKVEIETRDRTVTISAHEVASNVRQVDRWIATLRDARRWLAKNQNPPAKKEETK